MRSTSMRKPACFTVDLRNPDEERLRSQEAALQRFLDGLVTEGYEGKDRAFGSL